MKKTSNIITIILFIIITFYYCKVNGQDTIHRKKMNKKQVHITTSPKGLSGVTVTYNGSGTTPISAGGTILNAGSYSPMQIVTYGEYIKKKDKEFWSNLFSIINKAIWYIVPIVLVIIILIRRKDEEITLPDEFNQNY